MCYSCDFLALSIGHATVTVTCSTSRSSPFLQRQHRLNFVKAADIQSDPWQHVEKFIKQQQEQQYVPLSRARCSRVLKDPSSTILKYGPRRFSHVIIKRDGHIIIYLHMHVQINIQMQSTHTMQISCLALRR